MTESILITGGTGKFGKQFVSYFVQKGWQVIFTSTSQSRAEEFIAQQKFPANVMAIEVDLMQESAAQALVEKVKALGVRVNHLVNNARSLSFLKTNENGQTERREFQAEYLMDVVVPYELSMALCNEQPDELKTITNIGSQYGVVAANPHLYDDYPRQSPIQYGVAKAALMHLTKELAVRLADNKVRVNCIAYGGVEGRVDSAFKDRYANLTPSRRMLSEPELSGPLDALIQDGSSAVTGQTLVADGGWSLW
jgi:NAD(P)-dependent dehydrogenase (short-subunit alcohol dehydrogenase family)